MAKLNCWEFKKCGRQPKGAKEVELGVCPASTNFSHNGKNGGNSAGRYCWKVAGTLCGGRVQGTFTDKQANCLVCEFYQTVKRDEGPGFSE